MEKDKIMDAMSHMDPALLEEADRKAARSAKGWMRSALAAACLAVFVGALNLSPAFAAAMTDVPVLGGLFQVLTVRSFTDADENRVMEVTQPAVQGEGAFAQRVNEEIQSRVDAKIAEFDQLAEEYKKAFFATGGTQEEWEDHHVATTVTYDVKYQQGGVVSFLVESNLSFSNAYWERVYYNLDLETGRELTLEDVLGENWVEICNNSVRTQMAAAEDPAVFFDESKDGFSTVDEGTLFYIGEAGAPVVVFPPYAVAPGAMGYVEFEIAG